MWWLISLIEQGKGKNNAQNQQKNRMVQHGGSETANQRATSQTGQKLPRNHKIQNSETAQRGLEREPIPLLFSVNGHGTKAQNSKKISETVPCFLRNAKRHKAATSETAPYYSRNAKRRKWAGTKRHLDVHVTRTDTKYKKGETQIANRHKTARRPKRHLAINVTATDAPKGNTKNNESAQRGEIETTPCCSCIAKRHKTQKGRDQNSESAHNGNKIETAPSC